MMNRMITLLILGCTLPMLSACVSKKVFTEAETAFRIQAEELRAQVNDRDAQLRGLETELAKAQGGNEALLTTQDKLQVRIDDLQEQIVVANSRALGNRESLQSEIQDLEAQKAALQARLAATANVLSNGESAAATIAAQLRSLLDSLDRGGLHTIEQQDQRVVVNLNEALLFRATATDRLETGGRQMLAIISELIQRNPVLVVQVTGHTDNQRVPRQSLDNWQYAAIRAATVTDFLTRETGLSANRITLASQGEFQPRQSNQTAEGRARNRRIELTIQPGERSLLRSLRQAMGE